MFTSSTTSSRSSPTLSEASSTSAESEEFSLTASEKLAVLEALKMNNLIKRAPTLENYSISTELVSQNHAFFSVKVTNLATGKILDFSDVHLDRYMFTSKRS